MYNASINKMECNYIAIKGDIGELKELIMKKVSEDIENIDADGLAALQICCRLINHTNDMMQSYFSVLEKQDEKLDRILKALETAR
jgi:hypothetical protein